MTDVERLRAASRALVRELGLLRPGFEATGITWAECHALQEVERQGAATATELGRALGVAPTDGARVAAELGDTGWTVRAGHRVGLTDAGRERLERLHDLADRRVRDALDALDDAERATVVRGLELYADALARTRPAPLADDDEARDIAAALAAGRRDAAIDLRIEALFARHADRVRAVCLGFMCEPDSAAELAQRTLLRAWEKLAGFRGEARFVTWLVGIARYECLNARRKRADTLTEDGHVDPLDDADLHDHVEHRELAGLLHAIAAEVLDPEEQLAIHLRYVEQQSLDDIGIALGLTNVSGARALLQRSRRKLAREATRRLGDRRAIV